ncbi:hypothetical protein BDN72DRAFT_379838 [Pluteus cervinus]|uniref:Uncharacterized protein n=1 Tax=Pluteus cervinus TaxID=181527 RepID=A0ACD3B3B8_9AGAR|nr:hypothetical protein BDN72DRAFT_379838 [Pluteus cervinus]
MAFFTTLDAELDKIESFFTDRETEMQTRMVQLKAQIHELLDHRKLFHEAHTGPAPWSHFLNPLGTWHPAKAPVDPTNVRHSREIEVEADKSRSHTPTLENLDHDDRGSSHPSGSRHGGWTSSFRTLQNRILPGSVAHSPRQSHEMKEHNQHPARALNPEDYLDAKKKLKKAMAEHYR